MLHYFADKLHGVKKSVDDICVTQNDEELWCKKYCDTFISHFFVVRCFIMHHPLELWKRIVQWQWVYDSAIC